jgi:electron transfer flavoprotein beta subunit
MRIIVCVKQIIDPELPASQFKIDPVAKRQQPDGHPLVISPYDENALEVALQVKGQTHGHVTVLSLGERTAVTTIRKALAMGADEAIVINDPCLEETDAVGVASALAGGIRKLGGADLVLCGCESGDWGHKVLGPLLAEALAVACITFVTQVEVKNGQIRVRRVVEDGIEVWDVRPPVLLTVISHESNAPRYPKVKDIMAASRKPLSIWSVADINLDPKEVGTAAARVTVRELTIPTQQSQCEFLTGEPEEQVAQLFARLRERKVI